MADFAKSIAARSASQRTVAVHAITRTGTTVKRIANAQNIRQFRMNTGAPLTGSACVLNASMRSERSASATTHALREQGRNGFGSETEKAPRISMP